jgi:ferredoxin
VIDGKVRMISDLFCDGLGACIGHCPRNAISFEEREAEAYDESKVMANVVKQGPAVIRAHLEHLRYHGQDAYLAEALAYLRDNNIPDPSAAPAPGKTHGGCPGSRSMNFAAAGKEPAAETGTRPSHLTHWPVQLHLMSPMAPQYKGADVLLAADCTAYALGDFHGKYLKGRALAIACPKLDQGREVYVEKIKALIDEAGINTLTVMIMEVPCCSGLLKIAQEAAEQAARKVPVKCVTVGIRGSILSEQWT